MNPFASWVTSRCADPHHPAALGVGMGGPFCTRPEGHVGDHVFAEPGYPTQLTVAEAQAILPPVVTRWENR